MVTGRYESNHWHDISQRTEGLPSVTVCVLDFFQWLRGLSITIQIKSWRDYAWVSSIRLTRGTKIRSSTIIFTDIDCRYVHVSTRAVIRSDDDKIGVMFQTTLHTEAEIILISDDCRGYKKDHRRTKEESEEEVPLTEVSDQARRSKIKDWWKHEDGRELDRNLICYTKEQEEESDWSRSTSRNSTSLTRSRFAEEENFIELFTTEKGSDNAHAISDLDRHATPSSRWRSGLQDAHRYQESASFMDNNRVRLKKWKKKQKEMKRECHSRKVSRLVIRRACFFHRDQSDGEIINTGRTEILWWRVLGEAHERATDFESGVTTTI